MLDVSNLSRRLTWAGIAKRVFDVTAIVTSRKTDEEVFSSAVGDAILISLSEIKFTNLVFRSQ